MLGKLLKFMNYLQLLVTSLKNYSILSPTCEQIHVNGDAAISLDKKHVYFSIDLNDLFYIQGFMICVE